MSLLELAVKATLLSATGLLLIGFMGRASAATRQRLCLAVLLVMLALPVLLVAGPRFDWRVLEAPQPVAFAEQAAATAPVQASFDWVFAVVTFWLVGVVALVAQLLLGQMRAIYLRKKGIPASGTVADELHRTSRRLGFSRPPQVVLTNSVRGAVACGVARPAVLLSEAAEGWSEDERESVLLHELAHIRRRDTLALSVGALANAVYWPIPFVWLLVRRLRLETERAADDLVLSSGVQPEEYATCLLKMVRLLRQSACPPGYAAIVHPSHIEVRIKWIMNKRTNRAHVTPLKTAAILLALAALALPIAAVRPAHEERASVPYQVSLLELPAPDVLIWEAQPPSNRVEVRDIVPFIIESQRSARAKAVEGGSARRGTVRILAPDVRTYRVLTAAPLKAAQSRAVFVVSGERPSADAPKAEPDSSPKADVIYAPVAVGHQVSETPTARLAGSQLNAKNQPEPPREETQPSMRVAPQRILWSKDLAPGAPDETPRVVITKLDLSKPRPESGSIEFKPVEIQGKILMPNGQSTTSPVTILVESDPEKAPAPATVHLFYPEKNSK